MSEFRDYQNQRIEYIQSLHRSPTQIVLALSGGGALVLSDLLTVPGGSRTCIEAAIPYSTESLSHYIGRVPDQFCCSRTARNLATMAFYRARKILRSEILRKNGYIDIEQVSPKVVDVSHELENITDSIITRSSQFAESADFGEFDAYWHVIGVGCTASLATDQPKMGEHRVHVAVQTLQQTIQFSLRLQKDSRTRWEEERLVADLILNVIETARQEASKKSQIQPHLLKNGDTFYPAFIEDSSDNYPLCERIPLQLKSCEVIEGKQAIGSPSLVDLFFGKIGAVLWMNKGIKHFITNKDIAESISSFNPYAEFTQAIFPGSFSPIHKGHQNMINIAEQRLHGKVTLEISVQNINKPPLDYIDLEHRLEHINKAKPDQAVWLTQAPLFVHKAELFPGTTFIVGADTIRRFADLRFYHANTHRLHDILRTIALHACRFLIFARQSKYGLESLDTLEIPDMLRSLCDEIPSSVFTMNISSSDIRRREPP